MSKMATAAVVAWFYELNSNKQRELMARGVEQSEKGNCYKRRQLVYSIQYTLLLLSKTQGDRTFDQYLYLLGKFNLE